MSDPLKGKITTFQITIAEIADAFEKATRTGTSETFYRIKESAPTWLQDSSFMREIHDAIDGRLPDDWIYEHTMHVAQDLDGRNDDSADEASEADSENPIADSLVDTYTSARLEWLAMHLGNLALCDEAVSEGLVDASASIEDRIGAGQYMALQRIVGAVIRAAGERAGSLDEDM